MILQRIAPKLLISLAGLICTAGLLMGGPGREQKDRVVGLKFTSIESPRTHSPGAFVGVVGKTLLIGGGLKRIPNDGMPRPDDFSRTVHGLDLETGIWRQTEIDLDVAFAACVAVEDGLVIAGGLTSSGVSTRVVKLKRIEGASDDLRIEIEEWAPLPRPVAFGSAAVMAGRLLVVGGLESVSPLRIHQGAFSRNLRPFAANPQKRRTIEERVKGVYDQVGRVVRAIRRGREEGDATATATSEGWNEEALLPARDGLLMPVLCVRPEDKTLTDALYIWGGWTPAEGEAFRPARQGWKYQPSQKKFPILTEISPFVAQTLVPVSAAPLGPSHAVVLAAASPEKCTWRDLVAGAHGGEAELFLYHTLTDTWVDMDSDVDAPNGVVAPWHNGCLLVTAPAEATAPMRIAKGAIVYVAKRLSWLDWAAVVVYMAGMLWIGSYFAGKETTTEDYFLGGRKIPWWAAGLSIWATGVSAISFMAIPAKTFATNWTYIGLGIFPILSTYVAAYAFVPLLRRLNLTTVMEYSEMRFNRTIRTISSMLMVVGQIAGRMSITILLPAIAIRAVTGLNIQACILLMGTVATIYTVLGGIGAVIWTDVIQTFVMFGGAILCLATAVANVDGGVAGVLSIGRAYGKFEAFDWTPDLTIASIWVFAIWGIGDIFNRLGQEGMQRAFSTDSVKSARRSMITCAWVSVPGTILFYSLGSALFAFYRQHPQRLNPLLETDSTVPLFVAQQLPPGLAGLVIAGLFASAMSTLDTGMNSIATVMVRDWFSYFRKHASEKEQLRAARWIALIAGSLATGIACWLAHKNQRSLWDTFSVIMMWIGSGFGGIGALALLTTRAHSRGVLAGAIVNTLFFIWLRLYTKVHFFACGTICMATGFAFGYLFSLILPAGPPKNLEGLTLWTLRKSDGRE